MIVDRLFLEPSKRSHTMQSQPVIKESNPLKSDGVSTALNASKNSYENQTLEPDSAEKSFKRRDLLTGAAFNLVFCTVIAAFFAMAYGSFWQNMVVSHAIGWFAFAFCETYTRLVFPNTKVSPLGVIILIAGGTAAGMLIGAPFGLWLIGKPVSTIVNLSWLLQWQTLLTVAFGTLVGTGFGWVRRSATEHEAENARLTAKAERDQRDLADAQLNLVRTQVEPHMLFNTLANLRALIPLDQAQSVKMVDHLHDYLRGSLGRSRKPTISLGDEFKLLSDYLALMKLRMQTRLQFELSLDPSLANQPIPTWLLQPLVENAIKHGIEPSLEGGIVKVSATPLGNDRLCIAVINTGEPLPADFDLQKIQPRDDGGFGLYQAKERVERLFAERASFLMQSVRSTSPELIANEEAAPPLETQIIINLPKA
jgi:hypothetical protein